MSRSFKLAGYAVLVWLLGSVAWLHMVGRINLVTADLGRHLKNGELALVQHQIIHTNYYSYTFPDFPTVCHHWGAGVIFYLVWKCSGFLGLSFFYGALLFMTWAFFTAVAARMSSLRSALLAAALALPLVGYRTEIRPEGFTTLFLGVLFLILYAHRQGRIDWRWLWLVPAIQLVWVNLHILFILGFCLVAIFVVDALLTEGPAQKFRRLCLVAAASLAASFLNPFGWEGFSQPWNIFKVYGYRLAENQTVFFMMKRFPGRTIYEYFLLLAGVAAILVVLRVVKERDWKRGFLPVAMLVFFGLMACQAVRAIAMFGFFFIPLAADNWERVIRFGDGRWSKVFQRLTVTAAITVIILSAAVPYFYLSPIRRYAGLVDNPLYRQSLFYVLTRPALWGGLIPGMDVSAEFIRKNRLLGPIFNNYDIGGYFIYYLYPTERPFVDNRPEAYPVDFFQKVYGPMQADDRRWGEVSRQYGIELIYFYRHDMTDWGQPFLIRRLQDPLWAPVYVDGWTIILARRGGVNQAIIDRFELPKEIFKVRKN